MFCLEVFGYWIIHQLDEDLCDGTVQEKKKK